MNGRYRVTTRTNCPGLPYRGRPCLSDGLYAGRMRGAGDHSQRRRTCRLLPAPARHDPACPREPGRPVRGLAQQGRTQRARCATSGRDVELAQVLRVGVGDLLGNPVLVEAERAKEDDLPAVRDALMSHRRLSQTLFGTPMRRPLDVEPVERLAELAWSDYQAGRLGQVIAALPGLITTAQALEESAAGADATRCWSVSARIHHLSASSLAKVGEAELSWMSAERAMSAGEQSGDPLSLASAARAGTHALLAVGRFDDAVSLGQTAAQWLSTQLLDNDPSALSIIGMLYLRTATAAARRQDRGTTEELLRSAAVAGRRLGRDANYWQTSFGPTNVQLHRLSARLDLGDVLYVVENAPNVDTSALPVERSVAHRVDLARAYSYARRDTDALDQLLSAEKAAPQIVRHSATVRDTVKSLHRRGHTTGTNAALIGLAERCRAVQ